MKRRDFLKLLGICVVVPGTIAATAKVKPKQRVYVFNYPGSGVTNKQLTELIRVTLRDLPKGFMETALIESYKRQEKSQRTYIGRYYGTPN